MAGQKFSLSVLNLLRNKQNKMATMRRKWRKTKAVKLIN